MTPVLKKLRWVYIRNNVQSCAFTMIYFLITLYLFLYRYGLYADTTPALAVARASAMVIYWHSGLILVLILRKSINYVRSFGLARYFPLDHYVYFHKLTGWSIAFFSLVHTVAHLYNFAILADTITISYWQLLFSVKLGIGWFYGSACLTGWILVAILAIMLVFSMNFVRRTGKFEWFYYTHKLYVLYLLFIFFHASSTVQWLIWPVMMFLFEKISGIIYRDHHGQTYALQGTLLPSRVLRLAICKPKFFHFVPGDFVYVMVPSITKYEWHPITISSAPEDQDLTLHIRAVGEWTNRLYDHFDHAKTLTVKKMLEEWKCLDFHPLFNDTSAAAMHYEPNQESVDLLSERTMILPVPDDCNRDGCGGGAGNSSSSNRRTNSIRNSGDREKFEVIEMEVIQENGPLPSAQDRMEETATAKNDQKNQDDNDETQLNQPLMLLQNIHKNVQTNAVFLKEPLKIHLDGPYGAPSSNIFQSEHAVLIATGIGVTPFASILQSIMYRHIEKTRRCPSCRHSWIERVPSPNIINLRKVDFIWINRNQESLEWFVQLLLDLTKHELEPDDRFFDIHMYITSNKQGEEAALQRRNSALANAQNKIHLRYGRPDWDRIFQNIQREKRGKVTVFYCGRPDLSGFLHQKCSESDFFFKKEIF